MRHSLTLAFAGILCCAGLVQAETFFVNNLNGRDLNDGLNEIPVNSISGPVKSIRRAMEMVQSGDTIILANTGTPYYESLSFVGMRLSGAKVVPLTIQGNGATLSGLRGLPKQGWREVDKGLWQISFNRKGYYKLLRDGFALPEHRSEHAAELLATLPPGQWCAHRGSVFFRQQGIIDPNLERFDYAADEVGITLYQVEHVRIVDLTVEHFRVDGINAQNMCRGVILDNVTSRENGRAGLAVGGTSGVILRDSRLAGNGRHSALITGKGSLEADASEFDVDPEVRP